MVPLVPRSRTAFLHLALGLTFAACSSSSNEPSLRPHDGAGAPDGDAGADTSASNDLPAISDLADAAPFAASDGPAPIGACSDAGWCWSNPLPSGDTLDGVWGSGPDDVWAVGNGTIIHWDGEAWSSRVSGTDEPLLAIWGDGADDIWATG